MVILVARGGSAADVGSNLHDKYGKTLVQKVLTALCDERKLVEKVNGKQKIYYPEQV
jgi:26S proteasome regulatory subunit (ATPase 3-interacting protein)